MVFLPLLLLPLLRNPRLFLFLQQMSALPLTLTSPQLRKEDTYSILLSSLVLLPQRLQLLFLLHPQIRELLHLGLVHAIYNRVFPLRNKNLLNLRNGVSVMKRAGKEGS